MAIIFDDSEPFNPAEWGLGAPPSRGITGALNDYVIEAANAVLGFGKAITDFAKPGTELSAMIEDLIQKGQESQSQVAQQAKQELGQAIEAGGMEALKGVGRYGLTSPGLAISQAAGSFAIPFGAIRGGMELARAAGAGAQGVSRAGMVSGATVGAAGAGGDAAGEAYEMTYQGLIDQGVSEEEARATATRAARQASVVPAAIGGAAGVFGAEALLFGRAASAGGRSILRTAGSEALQEAVEEGATAASANIAAGQYVEGIDPSRGVVGSAAMGGLLGGITGGGVAALTRRRPKSLLGGSNDNLPGNESPSGKAIGEAINSGTGFTQVETDQNKIPREVAPGIFYTPATGIYTTAEGQDITESVGRARRAAAPAQAEQLEMVGAGAPAFDANQMTLPGMEPAMQPQPQMRPPAPPQMGAQPGQQELFSPSGAPTYGAAGPSLTDLALQRLQLEGAAPTRIRVPLAERAENLFSGNFIDENEHNTVYAMLRDSKYGQVERFLKGVEDAIRKQQEQAAAGMGAVPEQDGTDRDLIGAGRTGAEQVQPVGAGSVVSGQDGQQDVAAGVSGARVSTVEPAAGSVSGDGGPLAGEGEVQGQEVAKSEWDEQFRTNEKTEPTFDELSPERKAVWTTAVNNNQATGELFDALVSVHNKEKESAVQKRKTKEVPVRKRAAGGQEVGKRDAEGQKAARESRKAKAEKVAEWTGEVNKDGNPIGEGTYTWPDGDKFVGKMRNSKPWDGEFVTKDGTRTKVTKGYFEQIKEKPAVGKATPAQMDQNLEDLVATGVTGRQLLDYLAANTQNKTLRPLYQHLRRIGVNPKVKFASPKNVEFSNEVATEKTVLGSYNAAENRINVYTKQGLEKVLLHELIHAATERAVQRNTPAARMLKKLYEDIKVRNDSTAYGLVDASEFVAEAFSDESFQTYLKGIPTTMPGFKNMWQRFKAAVRKAIGLPLSFRTAFDDVMDTGASVMLENAELTSGKNVETAAAIMPDVNKDRTIDATPAERREISSTLGEFMTKINPMNYSKARRAVLGLRFLTDIRDNLAGQLPGLRPYVERSLAMGATTNELLKESSQIANRWANLGEEGQLMGNMYAVATASDIHPDIPLDQAEHKSGPERSVTNRHLFKEDGTLIDPEVTNNHKELSEIFKKLSPQAKRVYYEARDYMHKNRQKRQDLLNKNIDSVFAPLIADAKRVGNQAKVKELEKERRAFIREFGRLLSEVKGPYAPLSRFGEYYVTYKSEQYQAVEKDLNDANQVLSDLYSKYEIPVSLKKETEAATRAFVKFGEDPTIKLSEAAKKEISDARKKVRETQGKLDKMVKEGEKHFVNESFETELSANKRADELGVPVRLAEEHFRELNPINRGFIEKLSSAVGGALPQEQALQAREAMYQIYLASLPQTSALKNEMKRRGVAGFSTDMQRAFADYAQKDAHYLSRLEHMDEMTSDLLQMRRNKKTVKQDEIYNEIARRHAASLGYHQSPIEDGLSSLAFIYQLGISPAFLLTNMSQPWMISLPFMAGRHSVAKVTSELAKGFADAAKAATTAAKEQGFKFEIDLNKFSGKEKEMLEAAMKAGLLDISLAVDIGAYARGGRTGVNKVTHAMGVLPHQVEVVNRTMTALAAYRLEIQKGSSQEAATDYALRTLDKTHLNYSSTNAPYYLKPGVVPFGKVLFQYRKFQLGMLTLMGNQIKQAYKGDAEARKEARRTLFGIFGMHAIMTGAVGLPAVGTIMFIANILNAIFGDEDEPFDAETEFRRFLADSLGVEAGVVAAKGLPTLLGVDFSRNIGLGDITAPIRVLRDDKEGRDLYLEILAAGLGPTIGGLGPQFAEGIQMFMKGDIYRGVEGMTPRFFRDWTRAVRLAEQGVTTKSGQVIFQPEEISAWDKAIQAVGFPTTKISERGAAAGAVQRAKQTLQDRRSELTRDYVAARRDNDQRAMAAVQREIQEYNRKRMAKGEPTLKPRDLLNAFKQRERYTRQLNEQGVSLARSERALGAYGAFAAVR